VTRCEQPDCFLDVSEHWFADGQWYPHKAVPKDTPASPVDIVGELVELAVLFELYWKDRASLVPTLNEVGLLRRAAERINELERGYLEENFDRQRWEGLAREVVGLSDMPSAG